MNLSRPFKAGVRGADYLSRRACDVPALKGRTKLIATLCVTTFMTFGQDQSMRLKSLLLLITLGLMSTDFITHASKRAVAADFIIINANVHTLDPQRPVVEAIAVLG